MDNRYLYKAKDISNGEWVVGMLIKMFGQLHIERLDDENLAYSIDPSTICQCTGLRDKKGDLIWENDILLGHLDDVYPDDTTYACVIWNDNGFYLKENFSDYISLIDETDKQFFEVCGNIFDNPELLQEE